MLHLIHVYQHQQSVHGSVVHAEFVLLLLVVVVVQMTTYYLCKKEDRRLMMCTLALDLKIPSSSIINNQRDPPSLFEKTDGWLDQDFGIFSLFCFGEIFDLKSKFIIDRDNNIIIMNDDPRDSDTSFQPSCFWVTLHVSQPTAGPKSNRLCAAYSIAVEKNCLACTGFPQTKNHHRNHKIHKINLYDNRTKNSTI